MIHLTKISRNSLESVDVKPPWRLIVWASGGSESVESNPYTIVHSYHSIHRYFIVPMGLHSYQHSYQHRRGIDHHIQHHREHDKNAIAYAVRHVSRSAWQDSDAGKVNDGRGRATESILSSF